MASCRRVLGRVVSAAVVLAVCGPAVLAARSVQDAAQDKSPDHAPAEQAAQAQIQALVQLADAAMSGASAPSDFPVHFQNDFIRAQGNRVWVPMILTIDPAKLSNPAGQPLALYLRVAARGTTAPPPAPDEGKDSDKKKKDKKADAAPASVYPFEDAVLLDGRPAVPGEPIRIMRGLAVQPGKYDLYAVIQERTAPDAARKSAVLKQPLDVPDYSTGFSVSSVIVAEDTKQLPAPVSPDPQSEHPYSFGTTEIVVSPDHRFRKSQELVVLLQIYNPTIPADKKFNLEATYTFYRQAPDGEARFNATEPQEFSPANMGSGFDPSAPDRSIQAGQGVPLQSFPDGEYRLEITVTDKGASPAKALTQSVNFTVSS
jgi:hypothetical protein